MAKKTATKKVPKRTKAEPKSARGLPARSTAKKPARAVAKKGASTRKKASAASSRAKATPKRAAGNTGTVAKRPTVKTVAARKATDGAVRSKKVSRAVGTAATAQDPIQFSEEQRPLPKTRLSDAELKEFKEILLAKRNELAGDVERLTDEALNSKGSNPGDRPVMPIHMADLGSDNWEQEFTLGLIANEQARVREIDEALERIENKTYGVCLATRKRITKARLRAKPWAKYCIEYARAREEGRAI